MGKTGSYIKLDRGLKTNPLWLEKPFSKGQAWVDLLLLAQGVGKEKMYRGKVQKQKPGTVYTSILFLTNRWGWSRNKVYRFFESLMKDKMVSIQGWTQNGTQKRTLNGTNDGTTNGTIITIENWTFYQHSETNDDTKDETPNGTKDGTPNGTHNRKHIKKANRESKKNIPPKSPTGDLPPSGGKEPDRDEGGYEDIPVKHRDGTYHSFKTYAEYWDWANQ